MRAKFKAASGRPAVETVRLRAIIGGGQAIGELASGKKVFVWGGLPGEIVEVAVNRQKSGYAEAVVERVLQASPDRVPVRDDDGSWLSTSPWQIMSFEAEQRYKAQLIAEAYAMHKIILPALPAAYTDGCQYGYRNKVEFSWYWDNDEAAARNPLPAFFQRGSHGKLPVSGTSLAHPNINRLVMAIQSVLESRAVTARQIKTCLIRCDRDGNCVWQLYIKDRDPELLTAADTVAIAARLPFVQGGELIYSDPKSPASRITERLAAYGETVLHDTVLGVPFSYAVEGFFQVNLPVYEQALRDMRDQLLPGPVVDLYSGVGSIGLTIVQPDGADLTLVEIDANAFHEMEANIAAQGRQSTARPVLAATEKALEYITPDATVIVDPPRAGLHAAVIERLLDVRPPRIIYLSCNPVTQARDVSLLSAGYGIDTARGYNFFPRTPHIEHLVVLDRA